MVSSDGFPVEAVLENSLRQYPDAEPNIDGWLDGEVGGEIELTKPLAVDLHQAKVKGASVVFSDESQRFFFVLRAVAYAADVHSPRVSAGLLFNDGLNENLWDAGLPARTVERIGISVEWDAPKENEQKREEVFHFCVEADSSDASVLSISSISGVRFSSSITLAGMGNPASFSIRLISPTS